MNKYYLKKGYCYKINIPDDDINEHLIDYIDFTLFSSHSDILEGFSFDSERYNDFKLSEYTIKNNLNTSLLYFYDLMKDLQIKKLSLKQKFILTITENLDKECIVISLEGLSERTKKYLFFMSYFLINYQGDKTFVFLDFSTLNNIYNKIEIKKIEPTFIESDF